MPRQRCPRCGRPDGFCLCYLLTDLDSRTRVLILQDPSEAGHALNTARFATLGLTNAELRVGERFEALAEWLAIPGYRPCLLYPGEDARPLVRLSADETPMLLVVPDGTWRKARRLLYLNPLLTALPRVTLPSAQPSRYRLRKVPNHQSVSTLEAITRALNTLEAPKDFNALLRPFDVLIEGQIAAMGEATYRRNHRRDDQ